MITLYSGTPGSGKSLHCARVIYNRMRSKSCVVANFNINKDNIKKFNGTFLEVSNNTLTPQKLRLFAKEYFKTHNFKEGAIMLVLDECQLIFNAREWNVKGRSEWLDFFTNHRKYGYDILLIAQFDRMIDRQIRSLIEYECIHRKVSNFGKAGFILSAFALGKLFVCVRVWYPIKEKVGSEYFKANKKYYSLYDTFNTFD